MYGDSRNIRYMLGLFAVIALLFFAIFLIVRGGSNEPKVSETKRTLPSYATDSNVVVSQTIVGPITAAEEHYQTTINVTQSSATIELIRGYDGNVVSSRSYPMTHSSFSEFLNALDRSGFTKGNTDKALANDEGFCPTGQRYVYEIMDGTTSVQRFWATDCGGTRTFRGNLQMVRDLFKAQIPNYNEITSGAQNGRSVVL